MAGISGLARAWIRRWLPGGTSCRCTRNRRPVPKQHPWSRRSDVPREPRGPRRRIGLGRGCRSEFWPLDTRANRASMSQQKGAPARWTSRKRRLPQCNDWHFNCLVKIGRWWPGTRAATDWLSAPHVFASSTERLNDEIQARVYLARWIYADTEPARQHADQGIQCVPDAGAAAAVGLRWKLDHAGRRT